MPIPDQYPRQQRNDTYNANNARVRVAQPPPPMAADTMTVQSVTQPTKIDPRLHDR